jgi:hypothetical protein
MRKFCLALPVLLVMIAVPSAGIGEDSWFVSFPRIQVQPVARADTAQLELAGTIDTDHFSELVFSLGGEFKERLPESGMVGAILIPDTEVAIFLLEHEGYLVFPLEVTFNTEGLKRTVFISDQQTAKVAFPRYRVYFYNETDSGAVMTLSVYRTR